MLYVGWCLCMCVCLCVVTRVRCRLRAGRDGAYCLLNFWRAIPPEDPSQTGHLVRTPRDTSIFFRLLRPEFVKNYSVSPHRIHTLVKELMYVRRIFTGSVIDSNSLVTDSISGLMSPVTLTVPPTPRPFPLPHQQGDGKGQEQEQKQSSSEAEEQPNQSVPEKADAFVTAAAETRMNESISLTGESHTLGVTASQSRVGMTTFELDESQVIKSGILSPDSLALYRYLPKSQRDRLSSGSLAEAAKPVSLPLSPDANNLITASCPDWETQVS